MSTSKYTIVTGPIEEGRARVGETTKPRTGIEVSEALIKLTCGTVRDGNPRYWQDGESPPGMLYTWLQDYPWAPNHTRARVLATQIPLPGGSVANAGQKVEFHDTVRVGDRLSVTETLVSISDEKKTPLGVGHFVVTRADISRVDGSAIATVTNTLFRYNQA